MISLPRTFAMKTSQSGASWRERAVPSMGSVSHVKVAQHATSLCFIVTHPITAQKLLKDQALYLQTLGFRVSIIASEDMKIQHDFESVGISFFGVPMSREISLWRDVRALVMLVRLLASLRPKIVNASTPKAGFLGMIAAWLLQIPHRIYLVRGLRMETTNGKLRIILACTEKVASYCATSVLAVSASLCEQYIHEGLVAAKKIKVLGYGASNGVDLRRFEQVNTVSRVALGIHEKAKVIGFVGRLTCDKGIADLLKVFSQLKSDYEFVCLLIIGDFEKGDRPDEQIVREVRSSEGIIITGFVDNAVPYYQVMDVLVFPSAREGFPNVPIEASAAGVPVVAYKATGTVDAVEHDNTGKLVATGDSQALVAAIRCYFGDEELRRIHGKNGRRMVEEKFSHQAVREYYAREYMSLINHNEE